MKILAINGSHRKNGTTTKLMQSALEGAASKSAEIEMIHLLDQNIGWCKNCLMCYRDLDSAPLGPCAVDDDVTPILRKMDEADGVIFGSPVHNGYASGRMVQFIERITFRISKTGGDLGGMKVCPQPRRTDKVYAVASIVSAGGMPGRLRKYCDPTPWLKDAMLSGLNSSWVGDIYADAHLTKAPKTDDDWHQVFFLRKLTDGQLAQARDLGAKMADAVAAGNLRPSQLMGPVTETFIRAYMAFGKGYETTSEEGK